MCLAVPMKLIEIGPQGKGTVEFEGSSHQVDLSLTPSADKGDYLIVHAGFAIEQLDACEADERLSLFEQMAEQFREKETPS